MTKPLILSDFEKACQRAVEHVDAGTDWHNEAATFLCDDELVPNDPNSRYANMYRMIAGLYQELEAALYE